MNELDQLAKKYQVLEKADKSEFQRKARLLQSLWREEQGYPIGVHKYNGKSRPLGSRLAMPWAEESLANYLTENIKEVVRTEVLDKRKSKGKLYSKPRIFNDLLSSQPLCFNLFGELQRDLSFATKFFSELIPAGAQEVTGINFEYSPGRGEERYTGDHSAFDVYVTYTTPSGGNGFLGIEVKYHENLKDQAADHRQRYDEIAVDMGCFDPDQYPKLKNQPLQQIWRDHLLAGIHKKVDGFEEGYFVFLFPEKNLACQSAINSYKECLVDPASMLAWTVEDVISTIQEFTNEEWVENFIDRYLNFPKIDRMINEIF